MQCVQGQKKNILFIGTEQNILTSYQRLLASMFTVTVALGEDKALDCLQSDTEFSVVVTDIAIGQKKQSTILQHVRTNYPLMVRMALADYTDSDVLQDVVNSGDVFRFLLKPCKVRDVVEALNACVRQHELLCLEQELDVLKREKDGLERTLHSFIKLIEFRDPYTAGHMERTAKLSVMIAQRLEMSEESRLALNIAGRVHDVGKIAVPTNVLNKPCELSEAEYSIIQTHVQVGADIMKDIETTLPITRIIMEHHEHVDGTGYPNRLTGDELLPESKVLSVADTLDALLTSRSYRPQMDKEAVQQELLAMQGKKLDPTYVECGIALLNEGRFDSLHGLP